MLISKPQLKSLRVWGAALLFAGACALCAQEERPYLVPVSLQLDQVEPVVTAGENLKGYKLSGRLSGLAASSSSAGSLTLCVSHAFAKGEGAARAHGGAGAFVSVWELKGHPDPTGMIFVRRSGQDAFKKVYEWGGGSYKASPGAALSRLGPLHIAGSEVGFDQDVLVTGERSPDGRAFAIFGGAAYALPRLGSFSHGGLVALRATGSKTVVVELEEGSEAPESRLFVYVGDKGPGSSDVLERNGLAGGSLFAVKVEGILTEAQIRQKGKRLRFSLVPLAWSQDAAGLRREAAAKSATAFVRLGDACQDPSDPAAVYFCSRGSDARGADGRYVNHNGRLYRLLFDEPARPESGGSLEMLLDGMEGIIGPGAIALDAKGRMLVCEAPTFPPPGRDSSVWLFDTKSGGLARILEVNQVARENRENGHWEASAVADAAGVVGDGWWLVAVQAHDPSPDPGVLEDGQILAVHANTLRTQ